MRRIIALLLALLAAPAAAETIEFRNARWLDGSRFVAGTRYSVGGVLQRARPAHVDRVISLDGKYVIPPLAEAHNHWLEPDAVGEYNRRYLADGVFYVMDQANVPFVAERVRAATNRPGAVDYTAAILGITAPGGHPIQIMEQFVGFGVFPAEWKGNADRNAVLTVTSEAELDERWPLLRAARTDFVKIFLLRGGLDPRLAPAVVARAHRDDLRVSAHIYSAAHFRSAVAAGVDLIAHMPGTGAGEDANLAAYRISDEDARLAARRQVKVITTLTWLDELEDRELAARIEREVIVPNVRLLKRHGVPILIGSDAFRATPLRELFILERLGLFSNAEILRIATRDTPRAIFPSRKIGTFEDGGEASFLVLDANPLERLGAVRAILLRVKRGAIL
jgi:Amidohydrolase family